MHEQLHARQVRGHVNTALGIQKFGISSQSDMGDGQSHEQQQLNPAAIPFELVH